MRRTSALSVAVVLLIALTPTGTIAQSASSAASSLTFTGDVVMWTMAIKPDKTADFEAIMAKLRDGLQKSAKPERHQQAAGWRVVKVPTPMPDGTVAYVHLINPTVPGADYTIMQILYDEFPDERQSLYEQYRGAFAKNLSLVNGQIVVDLSKVP